MKQPEYQGAGWALHNSDCIEGMHAMPESSVDCTIFSPPFGNLFDLGVFADEGIFVNEKVIFNEGDRRVSIAMYSKDYRQLVGPTVVSLA